MGRLWTEEQLSAYLDQRLSPVEQRALEADLAHDAELQQRVALLRQTIALLQAAPLREPPRNYLLTPAMVATPAAAAPARPRRSPLSLWAMRLATVVSAAAFVVAVGLNLTPVAVPVGQRESAALSPETPEAMLYQEAPITETQALSRSAPAPLLQPTVAAEEPVYGLGGFEEGYLSAPPGAGGLGGGEEGAVAVPAVPEATATLDACAADGSGECAEATADVTMTLKMVAAFSETAPITVTAVPEELTATLEAPAMETPSPQPAVPLWVTGLLGVATAGLGYSTWRLSRRH